MINPAKWIIDQVRAINHALWHAPLSELSKRKTILIKQLRIIVLATRGFTKDKVQLRASALTFYTLLSIIPVIAIAFAIAKGFGLDENLESMIVNSSEFQGHQDVLKFLLNSARTAINETRGGYMAGIGMIILFWSVMSLLNHIESSFNHIWQISSSRPWYRKFTDYLTIMLIAPVFLILSGSITVFIETALSAFISKAPILSFFKPVISFLIKFAPYFLTWLTLTVLFIIMPNTKVRFVPALVSGIVSGTILQILLWLYIDLQFGISKLSAIYGSFAAVPLLIIWLQASWTIVLLGAELSFANQNVSRYEFESEAANISSFQRRALYLMAMSHIVKNFEAGSKPLSAERIGKLLKIPVRLVRDILQDLISINLVSEIHENQNKESMYQPAIDIGKLTVNYVLKKLDRRSSGNPLEIRGKEYEKVTAMLEKFEKMASRSDSNVLLKDL